MRLTVSPPARVFLAVGSISMVVASIVGGAFAATVFVAVAALFPVALILLGGARRRRSGGVGWIAAGLAVLLEGGALGLVFLRHSDWTPGFPVAVALMLVGLGLAPLVLVTWGYAATFEREGRTSAPPDRHGVG